VRVLAWPAFRKAAANPHAALLAGELRALGVDISDWTPVRALVRPGQLWHIHLPETVVYRRSRLVAWSETLAFVLLLTLARWRGTKMLWTIHDLGSNDQHHPRLEEWYWRWYVRHIDAVIALSRDGLRLALARRPALAALPQHVIPHGHYRGAYPSELDRGTARRQLGIPDDAAVILNFGLIRPYKNVPHLIRTFADAAIARSVLLIAGKPFDQAIEQEIEATARAASAADVRLQLGHIATEDVQRYFLAADLVALPYRRILNSGAVILALGFGRPVLVPDKGSMAEHQEDYGDRWVRLYHGELGPEDLKGALAWARETPRPAIDLGHLEWSALAVRTRDVYESL